MKRLWTKEEIEFLKDGWRFKRPAKELAKALGRSLRGVYAKANKLKLPFKENPSKIHLSTVDIIWLKNNFPHMRNEICAMKLGISMRSCIRIAHKLGLEKTREFMVSCQKITAKKAKESHIRNGTFPPKGVLNPNLSKGAPYRFKPKHNTQNTNPSI